MCETIGKYVVKKDEDGNLVTVENTLDNELSKAYLEKKRAEIEIYNKKQHLKELIERKEANVKKGDFSDLPMLNREIISLEEEIELLEKGKSED